MQAPVSRMANRMNEFVSLFTGPERGISRNSTLIIESPLLEEDDDDELEPAARAAELR